MAILNSLVMGKSRGSIGNITLSVLKGQTIAKQKIVNPTPSSSDGQKLSRGKMSNAVLAWQFLAIFLVFINNARKTTESNYNAFIRVSKNLFIEAIADSRALAAAMLNGFSLFASNFASISSIVAGPGTLNVNITTGGLVFNPLTHIRFISYNSATGANEIVDRVITLAEWNAGQISLVGAIVGATDCSAYLYTTDLKNLSNVIFSNL